MVGLDKEIGMLKKHIEKKLKWKDVEFFGRVYKNPTKNDDGKSIPEVYTGEKEYKEVLTNDLKSGVVFFSDSEKHSSVNSQEMETELSIIFILNLSKLKSDQVRSDIEIQHEALVLLNETKQLSISELSIGLDAMKEFDTSKIKLSDMQPWHIFSIKGKIKYNINNC